MMWPLPMSKIYCFAMITVVAGCTSTSPVAVLSPVESAAPLGQPSDTGAYPDTRLVRRGETGQLTGEEAQSTRAALSREGRQAEGAGRSASASTSEQTARELQGLAKSEKRRRLRQIESRRFQ